MLFTTEWLSNLFTDFSGRVDEPIIIEKVFTDSRVKATKALFIPIVGENFDGHDYIKQAFENGAAAILWNREKNLPEILPTDFPVFFVDNTVEALQQLAAHYRNEINPTVIGITGSNGKTTTKDLVATMVKTLYRTHHTDGNYNNHIGLPLTILSMSRDTEVLVLEMGMSDFGEIDLLSRIARPDHVIITNIGESHIEYLGSREGIAEAKLEITNGMKKNGMIIIDGDEELLNQVHTKNSITCGFHERNDIVIKNVEIMPGQTNFQLGDGVSYTIPLLGRHHALNATFAIALGERMGIDIEKRRQALLSLELTGMRFEMVKGINDVSIINDAYNASPTSMKAAIEVVKRMEGFTEKVLILGDILELGDYSKVMHQSVATVINDPITVVFTYGNESKHITTAVEENNKSIYCMHFTVKEELIHALQPYLQGRALLLFKASRGLQFESFINEITHP
ncbi:UDP-N-acetylmuramoyl-tripeptide--D-alanyl-D-alanine ligase [Virgibacillus sp. NKC19-16]|uniref:UDP-N-acetylmuramoyl-tripeptide--D-alanyl-D- alanine ligase n=1 Tax=Virgibacillus salidurans TaxID=2831673 RepID=UPI001F4016D1|nr:UDP-N-acetylmuramoyl-tripeptide--D-alanyl-D-alanine ligase [Virgibacillus sp. NKC19-16]UJL47851.1 UDP-N-acetylmuramoyl-tripeptide--D-alanyl-D-alanine ligase [Virgibacillus sp. NKC19-16]